MLFKKKFQYKKLLVLLLLIFILFMLYNIFFINNEGFTSTNNEWQELILIPNPYLTNNEQFLWLNENNDFSKNNFPSSPSFDFDIKKDIIDQALTLPLNYDIIDCGAHIGDGSVVIAHALKVLNRSDIKVYAIDPSKYKCDVINFIKNKNNLDNLIVINSGLSNNNYTYLKPKSTNPNTGASRWFLNKNKNTNTNTNKNNYDEKIIFTKLDSIVEEYKINNIGIIHFDVEGMENEALKGAENIINKSKPYMSIENNLENSKNTNYYLQFLPEGYKYLYNKNENNCLKFIN